jgi:uncharacterized protein (DUF305 family)
MKNNTIFGGAIISVLFGLFIGYAIWGNMGIDENMNMGMSQKTGSQTGGHMMPDGTMMGGSMTMSGMMDDMMANLKGKTGDAFDKAFIEEMVMHHEGAVDMAEAALKNAKHQEIKNLANEIISAQNKEIVDMKNWYKSWYGFDLK